MAKRTGNSSVNSSIRQNTQSTNEGFGALLAAQQASLGELTNIKTILELTQQTQIPKVTPDASHLPYKVSSQILTTLQDTLKGSRRRWKLQEDFEAEWRTEAKNIAMMAESMNTIQIQADADTLIVSIKIGRAHV